MTRRVALILAAVSMGALAGCDGVVGARMTFDDTEATKITEIVLSGGSSDLIVNTDSTATETRIRRVVYGGTDPGPSYDLAGGVLTLKGECGPECGVHFEITAPPGVGVRGELRSGDVSLSGVGAVDLRLTSGDVMVDRGTGPVKVRATSGDLVVNGGTEVNMETTSGNLDVREVTGPVTARASSGDINLDLSARASVTASVSSGEVRVMVPSGAYQLKTWSGSGQQDIVGVTDDPKSTNVLDVRTRDGDLTLIGR
ncbi:DUF4097 family beta strand repeat-containing protein [Actinoplanes sp. NEAU-A12]|uniref:DUF4097 family beta strand repeat-containing protein n=1 Tax=Actinoplanes sandaracinus TaxID=3045177 RepID=A0ABT6WEU6_9ACTN|nr:DUF4097 family beta strand repeat-containing protein [Actinoplanes sandaracinus]MDI6098243.1 DUF4097 family beta strand repeat-containing protein [Actinoplanes sandaracinus]